MSLIEIPEFNPATGAYSIFGSDTERFDDRTEDEVFPVVDPKIRATGDRIIVQLRLTRTVSRGGIELVKDTQQSETYQEVIAKVVYLGPLAYRDVNTLEYVPEGAWCQVGDIVRTIKWGGDRWRRRDPETGEFVQFIMLKATDVLGVIDSFEDAQQMFPLDD
jgi:co-chaperonin GroES (HSP10)